MTIREIPKRYAQALFNLTKESKEEALSFLDVLDKTPQLRLFLLSAQIAFEEKEKVLQKGFGGKVSDIFLRFIFLIIKKHRFKYIQEILQTYVSLVEKDLNVVVASIVTAIPLSPSQKEKLIKKLEMSYKKSILLEETIDPQIIGGARLIVEGKIIDFSLSSRLNNLKQYLLQEAS